MDDRNERFREDEADLPIPDREHLTDHSPSEDELAEGGFHELRPDEFNADEIIEVEDDGLEERDEVTDETVDADLLLGGLKRGAERSVHAAGGTKDTEGESSDSGRQSALRETMGTGKAGVPGAREAAMETFGQEKTTDPVREVKGLAEGKPSSRRRKK